MVVDQNAEPPVGSIDKALGLLEPDLGHDPALISAAWL